MAIKISVINGPNLNLLGTRRPEVYGRDTLADIEKAVVAAALQHGAEIDFFQSNHEGEIIDRIHLAATQSRAIVINAGAYSHTSIAIRDALEAAALPVIEVHLSNIFRREPYRHHTYVSEVARGVICGLGMQGYVLAVAAAVNMIAKEKAKEKSD